MITGNIKDCEKYFSVHKDFKTAFELLKGLAADSEPQELKKDSVKGNLFECTTSDEEKPGKPKTFEAHKKYIDIHYMVDGSENFGYANTDKLTPVCEYHEGDDYILLKGEASKITLHAGDFCVVFPEDAHIPDMDFENNAKVKRCVLKVRI